jgi:hypothetical protein
MRERLRPRVPTIANDNGTPAQVVSLAARRQSTARRAPPGREWAPAILATFFTVPGTLSSTRDRQRSR